MKTNNTAMKYVLAALLLLNMHNTWAQATFRVDNFSEAYYGKIYISDTAAVFSKGWTAIFEKKTHKQLIKIDADELTYELHDGKVLANIKQLPYGEQSQIIYADFNFDGKKDFAIMDGQNSCYHGPSFVIYLASGKGFTHSAAFTELAQENCGMFDVNEKEKKIYTMTKDGCCWHQFAEYRVVDNTPVVMKTVTEAYSLPFLTTTIESRNGTKTTTTVVRTIAGEEGNAQPLFSFHVSKNNKSITLYSIDSSRLLYTITNKDSSVEFAYPDDAEEPANFTYNSSKQALTFKNKNATYVVYDAPDKTGIEIIADNKTYNWSADSRSKKGSLSALIKMKFENVTITGE